MTNRGKHGKPTSGFPPFPPLLEIALRFPHSNSSGGPRESGKPKAAFPLSLVSTTLSGELKTKSLRFPVVETTTTTSVTFFREATRPGVLIVANHGTYQGSGELAADEPVSLCSAHLHDKDSD